MAKKPKQNLWTGKAREKSLDVAIAGLAQSAQNKLGLSVSIGAGPAIVGLQLESLAQRALFASTVLPLNKVVQLVGLEGCNKSALLYDFIRWHLQAGGGAFVAENENKDPTDLRCGIMQYRDELLRRIGVSKTFALQDWQEYVVTTIQDLRKLMAQKEVGYTIPVAVGIDSLTGTSPRQDIAKMDEAGGSSDRRHPLLANLIAIWMRENVQTLAGLPLTLIATNHLKPMKKEGSYAMEYNVPGGRAVPFMASFMIKIDKMGSLNTALYGGNRLRLTTTKNSYGPTGHHILVDFLWWHEAYEGRYRPRFGFDWHTASIDFLLRQEKERKTLFQQLMAICDLHPKKSERKVWSRALGIAEEAPVSYREAGVALEHRFDLLQPMYPLLQISERTPYAAGTDFRDQLALERNRDQALQAARAIIELPPQAREELTLAAGVVPQDLHQPGEAEEGE